MAQKNSLTYADQDVVRCIDSFRQEADTARLDRIRQTRENFDCYHLRQAWDHKIDGQSTEFLPLQMMGTEQLSSFLKQGVVELDNWFDIESLSDGASDPRITPLTIKKILLNQFDRCDFYGRFDEGLKLGLLGATIPLKVHGKWVPKPKYTANVNRKTNSVELKLREDLKWQLEIEPILHEDLYIDPSGRGLYIIHEMELDWFDVRKMAKSRDNPNGIYDLSIVNQLKGKSDSDQVKEGRRNRVKGQNTDFRLARPKIKIREFWGTLLDPRGEVIMENCVAAVANERYLIRKPTPNPFWHKRKPFIVAPIIRVPRSETHKAVMDAPTRLNKAANELYNLNLDNGIIAAYGVKQVRPDWLADESQIADGVRPGSTLVADPSMPPGQKVLERIDTAAMSPESLQMLQYTKSELQSAMLSSEARSGQLTGRDVKATEVVESSQTITSQLSGIADAIEGSCLRPLLELSWMTCIQHFDDFDSAEMRKVLGSEDAQYLASMSPAQRFAATVNGLTFKVYGISYVLNKTRDFRRLTAMLQTVFSNPVLTEAFIRQYDPGKLLTEIMTALDIETDRIENDAAEQAKQAMARLLAGMGPKPGSPGQGGPDINSQIPQAAGTRADINLGPAPGIPATNFPASRATPAGGPSGGPSGNGSLS